MPAGADAVVMVEDSELLARRPRAPVAGGAAGSVGARRRRRHPGGRPVVHGRHRGPPGGRRGVGERQRPDRDGPSAGDGGRAVDRRRAGRRRFAAGARSDPREQPHDAGRAARRGRVRRDRPRHGPRRRGRARAGPPCGRRDVRRDRVERWRQHGRLRRRQGRARADRRDDVVADRDQAGQAVRVRPARRARRCSVCRATR